MPPLVSIIIPAYNAGQWITDTLQSVLSQSHEHWEAIVVNDGSSDCTAERAASFGDSRIRLISQPNQGAAMARNRGFAESHGDYIQYLDADDLLAPDKIATQLAYAESGKRTLFSGAWAHFSKDTQSAIFQADPVWQDSEPVDWLVLSMTGGGMMHPDCWLTPRQLIEDAGPWKEELSLHDDGEFFARVVLQASGIKFVEQAKVYYRSVDQSLSRQRSEKAARSALDVCHHMRHSLLHVEDSARTRNALACRYSQVAYEFVQSYPQISREALDAFLELSPKSKPMHGGQFFQKLTRLLGFPSALKIRKLLNR